MSGFVFACGPGVPSGSGSESETGESGGTDVESDESGSSTGEPEPELPPLEPLSADVLWTWKAPEPYTGSVVSPLVANLTDDNGDGVIDLCDSPDIAVLATGGGTDPQGRIFVLDGASGTLMNVSDDEDLGGYVPFALGDIDGDHEPEFIVPTDSHASEVNGWLRAYEADGTRKWESPHVVFMQGMAIALADLDNDGDVEIMAGRHLFDHNGGLLWSASDEVSTIGYDSSTTVAADLDGDGDLEVVLGRSAYHHDGSEYYRNLDVDPGYVHVGDLDADGAPEVLVANEHGWNLLEHDGTLVEAGAQPVAGGPGPQGTFWRRVGALADVDGDGAPEILELAGEAAVMAKPWLSLEWTATVAGGENPGGIGAFDFDGDGSAEPIVLSVLSLDVLDRYGRSVLSVPRRGWVHLAAPVVADVNNDGQGEIVTVSSHYYSPAADTVKVIASADEPWANAPRIWNQNSYHVTNVNEHGTIPASAIPAWEANAPFRTQAVREGPHPEDCRP